MRGTRAAGTGAGSGAAVKNSAAPTPIPTTATPVSTVLVSAMVLPLETASSVQRGLQLSFASLYSPCARIPVSTAPAADKPPMPNAM
jgi:hypothetical protein